MGQINWKERVETGLRQDACVVAQLIGFNHAKRFDDLPSGFRINWEDAMRNGFFDNATRTYGELLKAYCRYLAQDC